MNSGQSKLVSREEWLSERKALLAREKALTHEREALSAARRALPMVAIEKDYQFETEQGPASLADLFGAKRQLIIYHFMFGPDWESGCPSCSFWIDNFDGTAAHLAARDTAIVVASNAPLATLLSYRTRMGWTLPWVSNLGSDFGRDYGVSFQSDAEMAGTGYNYGRKPYATESPGLSVFHRLDDGRIAHSYSTYGRGLDTLNGTYQLLDLTPLGRDEETLPHRQAWIRRHDEY